MNHQPPLPHRYVSSPSQRKVKYTGTGCKVGIVTFKDAGIVGSLQTYVSINFFKCRMRLELRMSPLISFVILSEKKET